MLRRYSHLYLLTAVLFFAACQERETQKEQPQVEKPAAQQLKEPVAAPGEQKTENKAVAQLQPTQGHDVRGTVTFTEKTEGGVEVEASVQGLSPGKHGIHIHEFGDCSTPDASSAGGHYNPLGSPHGAPDNPPAERHAGDLGNIEAGPDANTATYRRTDHVIEMEGENSIIGKSVVIHAGADDLTSQPAGDSGPRVACGVITRQ